MKKYLALDGWRGIAILSVFFAHFFSHKGINLGRVGVELFFVLSGRLMAELLFVKQSSLVIFLKRRVSRVWPALFAFVMIVSLVASLPLKAVFYALTFTSNYASAFGYHTPYLDHLWTLCIEEHTYLILAAIAYFVRSYGLRPAPICLIAAVVCMVSGVWQTMQGGDYHAVYWRTDTRAASIFISCALYLYGRELGWSMSARKSIALGCAGLALNFNVVPDIIKYTFGTLSFALTVCTIHKVGGRVEKFLCNKWLTFIGLLSFSLYLWQQPFSKLINDYSGISLVVAASALALASFYLVEKPTRRWLNAGWAAAPGINDDTGTMD